MNAMERLKDFHFKKITGWHCDQIIGTENNNNKTNVASNHWVDCELW